MPELQSESAIRGLASRRFASAVLVAGLLFSGLIWIIYGQDLENQRTVLGQEAEHVLDLQRELLTFELQKVQSDLLFLATQDLLHQFVQGNRALQSSLEEEYKNFALKKAVYDQIRFLDSEGNELIRVNYDSEQTEIVAPASLQSKSSRYYFQQAQDLAEGEVFVSPFDLNIEHGEIEQPIEPVIRFVTPVHGKTGERQGYLVLNYLGKQLLAQLKQIASGFRGKTMLVNPAGEYLQAADSQLEWGWLLDHSHSFRAEYSAAWEMGVRLREGQFYLGDDLFTFQWLTPGVRLPSLEAEPPTTAENNNLSELVLISYIAGAVAEAQSGNLLKQLMLLFAGVMTVVALLAYYWACSVATHRRHELQIAESEARLRQLSSALLETQESERRNLSRVLHDELGQMATAIRLDLGSLQQQNLSGASGQLIDRLVGETEELLRHLHEIASSARPSVLDDLGLRDALESLFSDYQQRNGVAVTSHLLFDQAQIPAKIGENAYRIVAEALSNVARHAQVSKVEVTMEAKHRKLCIAVEDTGVGFRTESLEATTRLGILGMRERAELLNGTLSLQSSPGKGTQIWVDLPLHPESSASSQFPVS